MSQQIVPMRPKFSALRHAIAMGMLVSSVALPTTIVAAQSTTQGNTVPNTASADLRDAMQRIGRNPKDLDALIDAGNASVQLGDANTAIDFFTRAEAISPNNGDVKLGLARAMLRKENPVEALRLFDGAARLGMPEREFAIERGLAYDLIGDFANADRQYQLAALSGGSNELDLRRGISLGVQGREAESMRLMAPMLTENDPAAWRAQAFIYASNGRMAQADEVAVSFLGAQKAGAMKPFFERMPLLTPAQKMAAIHYGHFPTQNIGRDSAEIIAMRGGSSGDRLTPQGEPFGPRTASTAAAAPVATVVANAATPPKFRDFKGKPQRDVRYTPPVRAMVAEAAPEPVQTVVQPPVEQVAVLGPTVVQPIVRSEAQTVVQPTSVATPAARPAFETAPGQMAQTALPAVSQTQMASVPTSLPANYQPSVGGGLNPPMGQGPVLPPAGYSDTAGTFVDSKGVVQRIGADGSIAPVGTVAAAAPTPVASAVATPDAILPGAATPTPNAPSPTPARRGDLGAVVGTVAVPEAERQATVVPVTPDLIAPASIPAPRAVTPKPAAVVAKAEPKPAAKPAPKPAAAHPKRNWVQIATGYETDALRFEYNKAARKNGDLFKGVGGWSSKYGKQIRLVVGPFDTLAEARAWEKKWNATGGQALVWQSADGTVVEALPTR